MHSTLRPRASVVAFVLLAISMAGALPEPQKSRVWLYLPAVESEEASTISSIMAFELTAELEKQGFSVLPEPRGPSRKQGSRLSRPLQGPAAVQMAGQLNADVAITGSVRIEGSDIILRVQAYNVSAGGEIFDIEERASKDIGIYNQVNSLAKNMITELSNWLQSPSTYVATSRSGGLVLEGEPRRQQPPERAIQGGEGPVEVLPPAEGSLLDLGAKTTGEVSEPASAREQPEILVTLLSEDEGAEIYIGQGQLAGTIGRGKLVIGVPAGGTLEVEKRKNGYHPDREDFQLADQPVEIPLSPLRKIIRFGFELFYTSSQFLGFGAGFRWYVIPDYLMFRADQYSYFSADSAGTDSPSAFHGDFRLTLGSYLFTPPWWRVRFGMASGFGIILSVLPGSTYRDLYWEVIDLWLDLNWRRWAVFFRAEPKYALGLGNCILERGFLTGYGPQYTIGWLLKW